MNRLQQGAALLISLLILLVLSIVGIAAMRSGFLQNLMSANTAQNAQVVDAADAAVGAVLASINTGSVGMPPSLILLSANPPFPVGQPVLDTIYDFDLISQQSFITSAGGLSPAAVDYDAGIRARATVANFGNVTGVSCAGMQLGPSAQISCATYRVVGSAASTAGAQAQVMVLAQTYVAKGT